MNIPIHYYQPPVPVEPKPKLKFDWLLLIVFVGISILLTVVYLQGVKDGRTQLMFENGGRCWLSQ